MSPAPKRPTRPEGRSRHERYAVTAEGTTLWGCREHALIALGRRLSTLDSVNCTDPYGMALLRYGHALGLRERLAGLHRDLVAATARDLAQTLGQAVRIEVIEQGPGARITHSIEVTPCSS